MIKQTAFKLITTLALLASIGGCTIKSKEQTKQAPIATPSTSKEDKEATKQKQIAYLKEHEKEIVDFVKSQNPKVESVQVNWSDIRWGEAGNGTPQGGGEIIELYGGFNHIKNSGWNVTIGIVNEMPDLKTKMIQNKEKRLLLHLLKTSRKMKKL